MKCYVVLAVEFFIVQGAFFSGVDEENDSQYLKTRYLNGADYALQYNLNHGKSNINIHDYEAPSRTLFSWDRNNENSKNENQFFYENGGNFMPSDARSPRNESNVWWPWSNYEEWAMSRSRNSLVNNTIQPHKVKNSKNSSEEKKKKRRKKKKKSKKNKKSDTKPSLESIPPKRTFFSDPDDSAHPSYRTPSPSVLKNGIANSDGYFSNENIPRNTKPELLLNWKYENSKPPYNTWDNNEMDNDVHSRYNYQEAIPFMNSKNSLLDKIKKHRNVDNFVKSYASRNFTDDVNECLIDNGGCEGLCINTPGSYKCHCPDGFKLDINKCIDVNECLLRNGHGPCQGKCTNQWGSYKCSCEDIPGTRLAQDGHTCEDVDECKEGSAGCSHDCINTIGSAFCLCPPGFMLGMNWKTCTDIDECVMTELQDKKCENGCENTIGSYVCS